MAFTDAEKARIRHHTGYLNVQEAQTFVLGVPAGVETQFIIEGAMNRVTTAGEVEARRIITVLDDLEEQMICDHELLAVESLGEIKVNNKEQVQLTRRYNYWVGGLCNVLGISRNPFDQRLQSGGINVRVG